MFDPPTDSCQLGAAYGGCVHALGFARQPKHILQQVSVQDRLITLRLSDACETSPLFHPMHQGTADRVMTSADTVIVTQAVLAASH
jgi:hypothetical protein